MTTSGGSNAIRKAQCFNFFFTFELQFSMRLPSGNSSSFSREVSIENVLNLIAAHFNDLNDGSSFNEFLLQLNVNGVICFLMRLKIT